jgi:hypothetical protein
MLRATKESDAHTVDLLKTPETVAAVGNRVGQSLTGSELPLEEARRIKETLSAEKLRPKFEQNYAEDTSREGATPETATPETATPETATPETANVDTSKDPDVDLRPSSSQPVEPKIEPEAQAAKSDSADARHEGANNDTHTQTAEALQTQTAQDDLRMDSPTSSNDASDDQNAALSETDKDARTDAARAEIEQLYGVKNDTGLKVRIKKLQKAAKDEKEYLDRSAPSDGRAADDPAVARQRAHREHRLKIIMADLEEAQKAQRDRNKKA